MFEGLFNGNMFENVLLRYLHLGILLYHCTRLLFRRLMVDN